MTFTYTGIEAHQKGNNVLITATAPDGVEKTVQIPACDIRENYQMSVSSFMDKYGDDETELWELFYSVENIDIAGDL